MPWLGAGRRDTLAMHLSLLGLNEDPQRTQEFWTASEVDSIWDYTWLNISQDQ